jgi:hypothetical protein
MFSAAGCLFTDKKLVLAGYQFRHGRGVLDGIGGSRDGSETAIETAFRETLEELFEIVPSAALVAEMRRHFKARSKFQTGQYICFVYNFKTLEKMMVFLKEQGIRSPLYKVFPVTVTELLFNRRIRPTELTHLSLIPFVDDLSLEEHFLKDFSKV